MGRPRKLTEPAAISIRFPSEVLARLDEYVRDKIQPAQPWGKATRSDAIRALVLSGLPPVDEKNST